MAEFWKYLADNRPQVRTRQALLLVDLQNDFLSSSGKYPLTVLPGFQEHLALAVAAARRRGITVVWVRTEGDPNRTEDEGQGDSDILLGPHTETDGQTRSMPASQEPEAEERSMAQGPVAPIDPVVKKKKNKSRVKAIGLLKKMSSRKELPTLPSKIVSPAVASNASEGQSYLRSEEVTDSSPAADEDCFLSPRRINGPCCLRGTTGAESSVEVLSLSDATKDMTIIKSRYSGFQDTQLLISLRMQLITELFICGCGTNTSIYATVVDAVRHGFGVNLITECMGYRVKARHDNALSVMSEEMGATTVNSKEFSADETSTHTVEQTADINQQDASHSSRDSPVPSQMHSGLDSMSELTSALDESVRYKSSNLEALTFSDEEGDDDDDDTFMAEMKPSSLRAAALGSTETDRSVQSVQVAGMRIEPNVMESPQTLPAYSDAAQPPLRVSDSTLNDNRASTEQTTQMSQSMYKNDGTPITNRMSHPRNSSSTLSPTRLDSGSTVKATSEMSQPETDNISASPGPTMGRNDIRNRKGRPLNLSSLPTLGPDDTIGDGDSRIVYDFFPANEPLADNIFTKLNDEVRWEKMYHNEGEVPRLVAVQGVTDPTDGSYPIYRHPSDQSPKLHAFSETVSQIRRRAEEIVGHGLNHALIQLYRTGEDNISEHSDKTLDIVKGSSIVNVSFGAQRTMRLRTKRPATTEDNPTDSSSARRTQRIAMPHNSIFILGPRTNGNWVHGIQPDKRRAQERSEAELAFDGMRISLTFRLIGTFLNADGSRIWGQGATGKSKEEARDVVSGDEVKTRALIDAFGRENRERFGGWEEWYGVGSDVLHLRLA